MRWQRLAWKKTHSLCNDDCRSGRKEWSLPTCHAALVLLLRGCLKISLSSVLVRLSQWHILYPRETQEHSLIAVSLLTWQNWSWSTVPFCVLEKSWGVTNLWVCQFVPWLVEVMYWLLNKLLLPSPGCPVSSSVSVWHLNLFLYSQVFLFVGSDAFNCCTFLSSTYILAGTQDGNIYQLDVRNTKWVCAWGCKYLNDS